MVHGWNCHCEVGKGKDFRMPVLAFSFAGTAFVQFMYDSLIQVVCKLLLDGAH